MVEWVYENQIHGTRIRGGCVARTVHSRMVVVCEPSKPRGTQRSAK